MLRRGLNDPPDPEDDSHPLFGADAQKMLGSIESSDVWQHLKAGIIANREALFASKPISTEDLWRTWGSIETLTMLLHTGPATVLQYRALAEHAADSTEEGSYVAQAHRFEGESH
jgi:hypothetical protein